MAIDVAAELAQLEGQTIFELRQEWRRLHQVAPPMRLSRDLLIRGILYKLQERALGGLSKSISRKLQYLNGCSSRPRHSPCLALPRALQEQLVSPEVIAYF